MNTSENNDKKKNEKVDQFDDLTRFLDEDFDTDDVDLFEFTTEEDSPLTTIKSIVLSLDWEITDDTLKDLADEIARLKDEEAFQADKVSQVYLQGLSKIGQYVENEGAHSHPNAIKLLLTFYYDFEKILSSDTITGAEITALLKADVRKFKILQYQIAKKHGVEVPVPDVDEAKKMGLVFTDSEALKGIRAVILELDWDVTDDGLNKLTDQLDKFKTKFSENRFIQILVQGLYSLKSYIYEERGRAHPEAYTLLHTFTEGIAKLVENGDLDDEKRQEIILEQINSLNNLKAHIASSAAAVEDLEEEAIEEIKEGAADEIIAEQLDIEPAEFPAAEVTEFPEQEPEDDLEVSAEESLGEDLDIAPALAGDASEGTEIQEEAPPEELAEKLEFFFGPDEKDTEQEPAGEAGELTAALTHEEAEQTEIEEESPPEELEEKLEFFFGKDEEEQEPAPEAAPETIAEIEEELEPFDEESLGEDLDIAPALAGDESEGTEIQEEAPPEELAESLASFFGADEEVAPFEGAEPSIAAKADEKLSEITGDEVEGFEAEEEFVPALAGSPEESGFGVEQEPGESPAGLAEKLEDLFGDEEAAEIAEPEAPVAEIGEPVAEKVEEGFEAMFEDEEAGEEPDIAPALADEAEESQITEEAPPDELKNNLEFFFGADEETVEEVAEGDEEVLLTSALTEEAEEAPAETARPMKTEEEYQAAVVQIRTHFKSVEDSLRQEIETLKKEIKNLHTQLEEK